MTEDLVALALSSEDDRLEVVVADNSTTKLEEVSLIDDPRFRYVRPPAELPLSANWEFGVGHATGEWVTILGNDDGVVPHRLPDYISALEATDLDAVSADVVNYRWPARGEPPSLTARVLTGSLPRVVSYDQVETFFREFAKRRFSTLKSKPPMPQAYMLGSIRRDALTALARDLGRLIPSRAPDWFLSVALGCRLPAGLELDHGPFIHGASADSMGTLQFTDADSHELRAELTLPGGQASPSFGSGLPPTPDATWLVCWADYRHYANSDAEISDADRLIVARELRRSCANDKRQAVAAFLGIEEHSADYGSGSLLERLTDLVPWGQIRRVQGRLDRLHSGLLLRSRDPALDSVTKVAQLMEAVDEAPEALQLSAFRVHRKVVFKGLSADVYGLPGRGVTWRRWEGLR